MVAPMTQRGIALVKEFEGYHKCLPDDTAKPYLCPANVPTVGYGTTYYEDGRRVRLSDPAISRQKAETLLSRQLLVYLNSVDRKIAVTLHEYMRDACGSLAYNIGTGAFGKSTAARMINQQRWGEVPRAFAMWRMGGGRVLAGLERRRQAEIALFAIGLKQMQSGRAAPPMPSRRPSGQSSIWQRILEWLFGKPAAA